MAKSEGSIKSRVYPLIPKMLAGEMTPAQVAKAADCKIINVTRYAHEFRQEAGLEGPQWVKVPEGFEVPKREKTHWLPVAGTVADLWRAQCEKSKAAIEKYFESLSWTLHRSDELPFLIAFVGDQHGGGLMTDHEQMEADAKLIASTEGAYAAMMGDSLDNHIKHLSGMINQDTPPDQQLLLMDHYFSMFEDKILLAITGNHDHWTYQRAGIDLMGRMFHARNTIYAPHQLDATIIVNDIEYSICMRHHAPGHSYLNKAHRHQRWLKHHGGGLYDVVVLAHLHELVCQAESYKGSERWYLSPGSYKITDDHQQQWGFGAGRPSCPSLIFYPDRKRIIGFRDLRDAIRVLEVERGDYEKRRVVKPAKRNVRSVSDHHGRKEPGLRRGRTGRGRAKKLQGGRSLRAAA